MTVIAGFQCLDALLMCADTEQAIGTDSKSQIRKIDSYKIGGISVAIGGAGEMELIEYVQHKLKLRLHQDPPRQENVDLWVESFTRDIWNAVLRPYRGFAADAIPSADFLLGLQLRGEYTLYKCERNMVHPVPIATHTSIGSGERNPKRYWST